MPRPEDFNPENDHIHWPAILAVFAVQMVLLIAVSIAVSNHSSFVTASSQEAPDKSGMALEHSAGETR